MSKRNLFAAVATIACLAQPAWAQDYPDSGDAVASDDGSWTGFYVGGRLGLSEAADENNETVLFDTNLDRTFGDAVRTGAGADAFSPGFCGGRALAPQAAVGCRGDRERTEYAGHVGFDYDLGGIVVGVIGEYARGGGRDSVTAFSTTPANYVLTRNLRDSFGLRARAGLDLGSTLIYGTGGGVYGRFRNRFSSSNVANAFQVNGGREEEFGYSFGGGVEQRFGPRFSLGAQFLRTSIEDDSSTVRTSRGTAPATNPFILVNPNGTDFRRGNSDFETNSYHVTASFRF